MLPHQYLYAKYYALAEFVLSLRVRVPLQVHIYINQEEVFIDTTSKEIKC